MSKIHRFNTLISGRSFKELFMRFFDLLLGYPIYILSFLFPRKQNRWVFGTNVGFADNAKYLFIATTANKKIDSCWITQQKSLSKELQKKGFRAFYKYSFQGLKYCLTASKYIFTYHSHDINFFTSGRARKVNLWHGVGIKKGSQDINKAMPHWLSKLLLPHLYEHTDMFLSTSPLMNEHFSKTHNLADNCLIYEYMYPRCSFLMMPKDEILNHIKQYETSNIYNFVKQLQQYKKVFIYMPTWRINLKENFIEESHLDFQQIQNLMQQQNGIFLLKLHPAVKIQLQHSIFPNIRIINSKQDIYPILPFTDVLITDYSSIYYDYILQDNKQAILFPFDIEEYRKHSDELAFDYDTYTPAKRAYQAEELYKLLMQTDLLSPTTQEREWVLRQFWGEYKNKKDISTLIETISKLNQ